MLRPLTVGQDALLLRIRQRVNRCGFPLPGVRVTYAGVSVQRRAVLASEALPSPLNSLKALFQRRDRKVPALEGVSGVLECARQRSRACGCGGAAASALRFARVWTCACSTRTRRDRPGSLTLLLGPPGSGKSTLLQLLSGRLKQSPGLDIRGAGSLQYNGLGTENFAIQRTAAYIDQVRVCSNGTHTFAR